MQVRFVTNFHKHKEEFEILPTVLNPTNFHVLPGIGLVFVDLTPVCF